MNEVEEVLRAHRPDMWSCSCGWPLNDSVGSVVEHLAAQIEPLMRCPAKDPSGAQCRLFLGHDGSHGDGDCTTWDRDYSAPEPASSTRSTS
jgi:hypothetical protein